MVFECLHKFIHSSGFLLLLSFFFLWFCCDLSLLFICFVLRRIVIFNIHLALSSSDFYFECVICITKGMIGWLWCMLFVDNLVTGRQRNKLSIESYKWDFYTNDWKHNFHTLVSGWLLEQEQIRSSAMFWYWWILYECVKFFY